MRATESSDLTCYSKSDQVRLKSTCYDCELCGSTFSKYSVDGANMQVTVKLFASFRNGRYKTSQKHHPPGTDCRKVICSLGLTEEEVGVLLVNGRHASIDQTLQDRDTLALFPLVGGG